MKIHWTNLSNRIGVAYGYSTHQKRLYEAMVRQGVDMDESSEVAVHLTTADTFKPVEGKYNILYSMYECTTLPPGWPERINQADLIVVPCHQNWELFKQYTKKPVEICLEGVDVDKYVYKERIFPSGKQPFIFLWIGATNPRKGTEHVMGAWNLWYNRYPEFREKTMLVMKTTQEADRTCEVEVELVNETGLTLSKAVKQELEMPAERIMSVAGNCIVDTRRLPVVLEGEPNSKRPDSLVEIYHWAHCFLLPSRGEGFGLTLAEAASTGLPCIYTPWGGPRDFMTSEWGYPVKWKFAPVKTVRLDGQVSHESWAASADIKHIVRRMEQVYFGYEAALEKGKKAAAHMRKHFTWDISARRMMEIIEKYTGERVAA